jgi:hypothetical protein
MVNGQWSERALFLILDGRRFATPVRDNGKRETGNLLSGNAPVTMPPNAPGGHTFRFPTAWRTCGSSWFQGFSG